MDIIPLTVPAINWPDYIKLCQKTLGYSPTRWLDKNGIKPNSGASFFQSLDLINKGNIDHQYNSTGEHIHMSFACALPSEVAAGIASLGIKILIQCGNKREDLVIMTGSLNDWQQAIIKGCREERSFEVREVLGECLIQLEMNGYKNLWASYNMKKLDDNTIAFY